MKVIFLDIDGVMNSQVLYRQRHWRRWLRPRTYWYKLKKLLGIPSKGVSLADYQIPEHHYTYAYQIKRLRKNSCPDKWEWLSEFCNTHGVKICVSSVWKNHFWSKKHRFRDARWERALRELGFDDWTYVGSTGNRGSCRGEEIQRWLDAHPEVEDYAILDDDRDMLPEQMDKLHHCDPWFGMSPNHLYRIKRQFNKE